MKKRLLTFLMGLIMITVQAVAQQTEITGTVISVDDGSPLPGVSVKVKGTTQGTSTNANGKYTIRVDRGAVLVFSFIGSATQEKAVGANSVIDVKLGTDSKSLDEVVVVGYGTQKRANLTGAVSTVDTEVLQSRPVTDVGRALQGTTPGLSITTSSGAIGQNPSIKLRGNTGTLTGTGGAQPLILVDNVEIPSLQLVNPEDIESISVLKDAASTSIYGTRGAWGVILITTKTGKKGAPTRVQYSNNFSYSTPTTTPQVAPAADGAEMAFLAFRRTNPSTPLFSAVGVSIDETAIQKMREWETLYGGEDLGNEMVLGRDFEIRENRLFFYRPWDVNEMFMRDYTPQQNHNLSVSGGSEKTSYNLGVGYLGQEGVLKANPDQFARYNLNLGINTSVNDWFDARGKVLYSNSILEQPFVFAAAVYDPWYYLYRWPAIHPYGTYEGKPFRNAVTEVEQANMNKHTSGLTRVSVGGTLRPVKGLTVDADYTYTSVNNHQRNAGGSVTALNYWAGLTNGQIPYQNYTAASYNKAEYNSYWSDMHTGKLFATYSKDVNDHAFKVIAGGDVETFQNYSHNSARLALIDPNLVEPVLATGDQTIGSTRGHWNTAGAFGRINYSFRNKFLLEVNGRYDGSSRLSPNLKWGFFPSMSAGYIISEEPFMQFAKPVLSSLKFRGSWGEIGNQNTSVSSIYSVLPTTNSNWLIDGQRVLTTGTPAPISGTLTWESVATLDFGLDARVLNDKVGIVFDWYQRTTKDMHSAGAALPSSYGATAPRRNFGELQTTGWEIAVDFNHRFANGLTINAMGTLTDFKEKLTKYEGSRAVTGNYQGKVLGEIWGYETDRFFTNDDFVQDANGVPVLQDGRYVFKEGIPSQAQFEGSGFFYGPGDIKYVDANGDGAIWRGDNTVENPGDQKVIGNSTPRYQYGFRLGADFKGIDFTAFFQGVGKRDFWAQGPMFVPGWRPGEAWYAHQLDYWTEENQNAFYPRVTQIGEASTKNFYPQTKYLLNLAYLRMKNLAVGYTLPQALTRKAHIERLRIYFSGENLFEWDKLGKVPIDPEVNVTEAGANDPAAFGRVYPYRRSVSLGLQVTL
ncbi:TonB-linked SusC/RagA family outer membrane protein [Arcticibacter pallidicorallinus]|uniref:TonB-linked SusC/RagA family outer membrane protein n=1 Tax=Arcticibacter pallidicorallinus TaxID=1259464 RepID=A0A2T0U5Y9_9SPHI|nr:TonB-dependent receptor [Arcticibacter pallidicorallinus]PRY53336.1 TonB-linked SusC/RagA family outer membrane protein [Arcticibacter pallidicorallinus]